MGLLELFILAVGLSMDAFAVSVCKGLAMKQITFKNAAIVGAWFGGFQALMPLIGWLLGSRFKSYITAIDHWIAFVLLLIIGANMIKESFDKSEESANASLGFKIMVIFIGSITFTLSAIGVKVGSVFGVKYKSKAELAGGIILILIGTKILLEHLGIISF